MTSMVLHLVEVKHNIGDAMRLNILSIMCAISIGASIPIPDHLNEIKLLNFQSTITGNETNFSYNLDDGQQRSETISITNDGLNHEQEISVSGSFSFNGSDGKVYLVEYVADKNGYQPKITIVDSTVAFGINGIEDSFLSGQVLKSLVG